MAAVVHTVITCGIDPECFDRFFSAMAMDLSIRDRARPSCGRMNSSGRTSMAFKGLLSERTASAQLVANAVGG